jgi:hypothetical protein
MKLNESLSSNQAESRCNKPRQELAASNGCVMNFVEKDFLLGGQKQVEETCQVMLKMEL